MPSTQLIGAAVGTSLLFLGLAAVVAWSLRRRSADRILLLFGIWCALYGARLIAEQPAIVAAPAGSGRGWAYFRALATYAINIPIGLFIEAVILLYTDGIPEARSPAGEFLDFVRVRQWLAEAEEPAAARIADQVIGRLREWRGGDGFEDDVTFVVARVGG